MLIKRSCHIVSLVLITAVLMPSLGRDAEAQVDGAKPAAKKPLNRSSLNKFRERATKPAARPEETETKPAVDGAAPQRKTQETAQAPGLAGWIRHNWKWAVGLPLGAAALGLSWFLLAGKRRKDDGVGALLRPMAAGSGSAEEGAGQFSSTRIRAADVDSRLSGPLDGEEVETDQDYALVVEEDALSAADPQDGGSPEEVIDACLQGEDFVAAYETYARLLEEASSTRLDSALEQRLDRRKRPLRFWNIILRHTPQMRLRRSSISISATRTFIHAVSKKAASFSVFSSRPRRMKHAGSAPGPFLRRWRLIRPDNGGCLGPIRHPTGPPARPLLPRGRLKTASLLQGRLLGLRAGACL